MTTFDVRQCDLTKLNSLTKYPSIPTYHALDTRNGGLIEEPTRFSGTVIATEKVDGTNARVVCVPGGMYVLGSREELLYGRGDLIGNPALGIVEALKGVAERLAEASEADTIIVFYLEVYGGKVTAASKQYTGGQSVGYRVFDIARIDDVDARLAQPIAQISSWRDAGGQVFASENALAAAAHRFDLLLTPRVATLDAAALPTTINAMDEYLKATLPASLSTLDDSAGGRPEGLVLRSVDRSVIAKARVEDYERTLRRRRS